MANLQEDSEPLARRPLELPSIAIDEQSRIRQVMDLLVTTHSFPIKGAAGLLGNLRAESGLLPNRIEGSNSATPMRARNTAGVITDFSAEDVMNRDPAAGVGPRLAGVGLAQWTSPARRAGLFEHVFNGVRMGSSILFSDEGQ